MIETNLLLLSGTGGYHTYRIPAAIVTAQGTVVLVVEGRRDSESDFAETALLCLRSEDGGNTWSTPQVIWEEHSAEGDVTCGNPTIVEDVTTHRIWLAFTRNNERAFVTSSDDEAKSWAAARDISAEVNPENWPRYWIGPGHGIQLTQGAHQGRLIFPSYHIAQTGAMRAHMIYSDDHGQTWITGKPIEHSDQIDLAEVTSPPGWWPQPIIWHGCECMAVETTDGRLYLTNRNYPNYRKSKTFSWSNDGGATWSPVELTTQIPGVSCQASILRLPATHDQSTPPRYLISSIKFPHVYTPPPEQQRSKLNLYISDDECATWRPSLVIEPGHAAYSDLVALPDGTILCFYEGGEKSPYESIFLARFDQASIT